MFGLHKGKAPTGVTNPNAVNAQQLANAQFGAANGVNYAQQFLGQSQPGAQQAAQSQQSLLAQLQQQALGQGPNPAMAQLAQATGANVANQAALMGSARGMDPGLAARQAAMQGGAIQQQAAGQGAIMQAQQQLAAQQALQNQQAQMFGQGQTALNGFNAAAQGNQGQLLGGMTNQNEQNIQMQSNINNANAGLAKTSDEFTQKILGGVANGISAAAGVPGATKAVGLAHGGEVPCDGPQSHIGQHFAKMKSGGKVPGKSKVAGNSLKNDTVPAMLSPGEVVIPRSVMQSQDPARGAADFVARIMAGQRMGKK